MLAASAPADAQVAPAWQSRFNTILNRDFDRPSAVAVDAGGNVYVTGSNYNGGGNSIVYPINTGFITIKYDAGGNQLWLKRYNGPAGGIDEASAIAVDAAGNVYVTGKSDGDGSGANFDYATVKYAANGDEIWVNRYDSNSKNDEARALTVDAAGNVYVTGTSFVKNNTTDIVTVKYNAAGTQLWAQAYAGGKNDDDEAVAIAADGLGNVFVAGVTALNKPGEDFATIKYDANGNQLWVKGYNGPASASDQVKSLVVDGAGNVVVAGYSTSATGQDFTAVKYSGNGTQLWVQRYNGAANGNDQALDVATDGTGNVYLTGFSTSASGQDYATVKYDANGTQLWVSSYNGAANAADQARDLTVDGSGNVLVTGYSTSAAGQDYATVKYDANGNQLWAASYNGPANAADQAVGLGTDAAGNVYVAGISNGGASNDDFTTVKYGADGSQAWVQRYVNTTNLSEVATAQRVDANGHIYVTGYASGNSTGDDIFTIKYDANGNVLWAKMYNGPASAADQAKALAVDGAGNVYVAGYSTSATGGQDFAALKYDANGNLLWVRSYNGPARGADQAQGLAVDASGNVYVTGHSLGNNSGADFATLKYDPNGILLWAMRYNGLANGFDQGTAVAADALGSVYVTGTSINPATGQDYTTIKYDALGTQLWVKNYNGSANAADQPSALVWDGAGNLLVTGYSTTATGQDYATVKYDANGNQLWAASYNGLSNGADQAKALAVDGAGNVYVTGYSTTATGQDYATVKYDANGVQLWAAGYNGAANAADQARALAVDGAGNVYVAGYSTTATGQDYAWVKYSPLGAILLAQTYNGPANAADQAIGVDVIEVGTTALLYLAGTSVADAVAAEDLLVIKYKVFTATTWTGVVSKDWNDAANWDNGLPNALIDAIIPAGVPNNPDFASGNASMKDLLINGGQLSLTGGVFQIAGNVSNTAGTLLASGGGVSFTGSVQQTVSAASGATNTFHSLTVGAPGIGLLGPAAVKGVLTLVGNLTTNGHKLLLVSDAAGTAMLVDNSGGVVNGTVTMQRYINPRNPGYGYRHFSSPVANTTVADFGTEGFTPIVDPEFNNLPKTKTFTAATNPNVQGYDESRISSSFNHFDYGYYSPNSLSDPLVPGRGYSVNLPATATVDFVGTLNNGTISLPLSRGPVSNSGWHLLGNPYPAPIDWDNITRPAGLNNAVYVYQSSGPYAGSYASYINGTGTLTGGIIPAMQGFLVRVTAPTTFTFTNAARLTTYGNPAFNKMQAEARPTVKLQLQSKADGQADQTVIYFDPTASLEADEATDAYKLNLPGVVRPSLYSLSGAQELAVNGLAPLQGGAVVVPLGVSTTQSGQHTLRAEEILNFSGEVAVWLEDKQAGKLIDLTKQPEYTFLAGANNADRFYLHFNKQKALTTAATERLLVYPNPTVKEDINISMFGLKGSKVKARLTNSLGREVLETVLPVEAGAVQGKITTAHLPAGVYYLQLSDGKPLDSKKIVVQ